MIRRHELHAARLRCRRAASWRLPVLESGHADPWRYPAPGERGYPEAAEHLLTHGFTPAQNVPALKMMWQAGGPHRRNAEIIAAAWELAS